MRSEVSYDQLSDMMGEPVALMGEKVSADLFRLYRRNHDDSNLPVHESGIVDLYGGIFGNAMIGKHNTIAKHLVSAEMEMVRNAAEHGQGGDPNRRVDISRSFYPDYALIVVNHDGEGFDYNRIIEEDERAIVEKKSVENARGLTSRGTGVLRQSSFKEEGGEGIKRLICDLNGDFDYADGGKTAFYFLRMPEGYKISSEHFRLVRI